MDTWPIVSVTDDDMEWAQGNELYMGPDAADCLHEAVQAILNESDNLTRSTLLKVALTARPDSIEPANERSPLKFEINPEQVSTSDQFVEPMNKALKQLVELYEAEIGRAPYDEEVLAGLDFVIAPLIDDGRIMPD